MEKPVRIFVEGDADKKFVRDYIAYLLPNVCESIIVTTGGWTNIYSQKEKGESIRNQMTINTNNEGVNIVIFDADDSFVDRKQAIEEWKQKYNLSFALFLFPNNQDEGMLENLLEKIIQPDNQPIFNCWKEFENCLQGKAREKMQRDLTTPALNVSLP